MAYSFSILDLKSQAVRLPISKSAQILLSELLTWSGEKGYCWWSVPKIAKDLQWSQATIWRKVAELKTAGFLVVIPRSGRSNIWVPLPGQNKLQRIKNEGAPLAGLRGPFLKEKENLKRCTVPDHSTYTTTPSPAPKNENAVKICSHEPIQRVTRNPHQPVMRKSSQSSMNPKLKKSPLTQDHRFLVEEIERITGDTWSRGHFINLVRQIDETTIYRALSITREKMALESGVNGGAYFSATVKGMIGTQQVEPKPVEKAPSPQLPPPQAEVKPSYSQTPRPVPPDDHPEPFDPEALRKGWKLFYQPGYVEKVLNTVKRFLTDWDVHNTWKILMNERQGCEEESILDELLDLAILKIEYKNKVLVT